MAGMRQRKKEDACDPQAVDTKSLFIIKRSAHLKQQLLSMLIPTVAKQRRDCALPIGLMRAKARVACIFLSLKITIPPATNLR